MRSILILTLLLVVAAVQAQQYTIGWYKIAGGGGASSGGAYSVKGTIGQSDAGAAMSGNLYSIEGGFWSLLATLPVPGAPPLTIQPTATNTLVVSWPVTAGNWVLQESATGVAGTWNNVSFPPVLVNGTMQVILPASESSNQFRLVPGPTALQLWIARGGTNTVVISWAAPATGWSLQQSSTLAAGSWGNVSTAPVQTGDFMQVTLTMSAGRQFYRLAQITAPPQLMIGRGAASSVVISWPAPSTGWVLQENSTLGANTWTNSTLTPAQAGSSLQVTVSPPLGNKFYRLKN